MVLLSRRIYNLRQQFPVLYGNMLHCLQPFVSVLSCGWQGCKQLHDGFTLWSESAGFQQVLETCRTSLTSQFAQHNRLNKKQPNPILAFYTPYSISSTKPRKAPPFDPIKTPNQHPTGASIIRCVTTPLYTPRLTHQPISPTSENLNTPST